MDMQAMYAQTILYNVYRGVDLVFSVASAVLVLYCVLSWIAGPNNPLFRVISTLAQPLIAPFRWIAARIMNRGLMFDIAPLLALFALNLIRRLLTQLLFYWM